MKIPRGVVTLNGKKLYRIKNLELKEPGEYTLKVEDNGLATEISFTVMEAEMTPPPEPMLHYDFEDDNWEKTL